MTLFRERFQGIRAELEDTKRKLESLDRADALTVEAMHSLVNALHRVCNILVRVIDSLP